jgi:hypothetical protein
MVPCLRIFVGSTCQKRGCRFVFHMKPCERRQDVKRICARQLFSYGKYSVQKARFGSCAVTRCHNFVLNMGTGTTKHVTDKNRSIRANANMLCTSLNTNTTMYGQCHRNSVYLCSSM